MIDRRRLLVISGATAVITALPATALALSGNPSTFEQFLASAVSKWAGRTGASASAAGAAFDGALATEAGASGLGLIEGLSLLGPLGLAAAGGILLGTTLYITLSQSGYQTTQLKTSGNPRPSTVQQIASDAGVGGVITYNDGSTWANVLVGPTGNPTSALPSPWQFFWDQANPDGSWDAVYYYSGTGAVVLPSISTSVSPYSGALTDATLQAASATQVSQKSMVDLLNTVLAAASAQNSAVPGPATSPFTAADLPTTPLTIGDLLPVQSATPQVASTIANGASNSSPSASSASSSSSAADSAFALPGLPLVPDPPAWIADWQSQIGAALPQIPAHTSQCPVLTFSLPTVGPDLSLSLQSVSFDQHCAVAAQIAQPVRVFAQIASAFTALMIILKA